MESYGPIRFQSAFDQDDHTKQTTKRRRRNSIEINQKRFSINPCSPSTGNVYGVNSIAHYTKSIKITQDMISTSYMDSPVRHLLLPKYPNFMLLPHGQVGSGIDELYQ